MTEIYGFEGDIVRRIGRAVRAVEGNELRQPRPRNGSVRIRPSRRVLLEGTLDGALAAADSIASASTATLSVYKVNSSGGATDTGDNITVTNRSAYLEADSGDHMVVERVADEWRPVVCPPGGGGYGKWRTVTTTGYTLQSDDFMLYGNTVAAGGKITVACTVGPPIMATVQSGDAHMVTILNWMPGGSNIDVAARDYYFSISTKTLTIGDQCKVQLGPYDGALGAGVAWYHVD